MKNTSQKTVTRFAPSPTGFLHIGGARTALFSYLFARHHGGDFVLRIEDTDTARSKKEYEDDILETMKWLGLEHDAFFRQSERLDIYKKYLEKIVASGHAYVSKEELTEESAKEGARAEVIRFKNPNKKIAFDDLIRGTIEFDTTELGDFVIAKSMSEPLYHFAVVVDDFEMGITHVIRGEEHISNTPRQILILEAIGATRPEYAHIPLILAPDKSKLSKRFGAVAVTEYKNQGYMSEALVNFLALLGWNPGTEQEIFTHDELVSAFDLSKVQKGGAVFNETKLLWVNHEWIKKLPKLELFDTIRAIVTSYDSKLVLSDDVLEKIAPIILERIKKWGDLKTMLETGELDYFFREPSCTKESLIWREEKDFRNTLEYLKEVLKMLSEAKDTDWASADSIKNIIWDYATEKGRGAVLWPIRYALTGKEKSPDPFTVAATLGKEETLKRLENAITLIS